MNNTFNPKRFGLLFKKTMLEKPTQMFGFTGLIFLFILIMYYIMKTFASFQAAQNISFIWGLVGGDFILTSFMFNYFSSTASGSFYLTLPVSNFERWLCAVVIAFYRIMDAGFVAAYHNSLDPNGPFYKIRYDAVYLLSFNDRLPRITYPMFLIFSGIMLVGSLYFNKVALVKVALATCILFLAIYGLNYLFAFLMFKNIDDAFPFQHVAILVGREVGSIELPKSIHDPIWYFINFGLPVILWGVAFIRLREKEF
jgi:hypothetical protein